MIKSKVILTTMVMIEKEDGMILVQDRKKQDWPGINFPGGHVEDNESIIECAKREIKEETGLTIDHLIPSGYYEWNVPEDGIRHLSLLFYTNNFSGDISASSEGKIFWIKKADINNYSQATDFDKVLMTIEKERAH